MPNLWSKLWPCCSPMTVPCTTAPFLSSSWTVSLVSFIRNLHKRSNLSQSVDSIVLPFTAGGAPKSPDLTSFTMLPQPLALSVILSNKLAWKR